MLLKNSDLRLASGVVRRPTSESPVIRELAGTIRGKGRTASFYGRDWYRACNFSNPDSHPL